MVSLKIIFRSLCYKQFAAEKIIPQVVITLLIFFNCSAEAMKFEDCLYILAKNTLNVGSIAGLRKIPILKGRETIFERIRNLDAKEYLLTISSEPNDAPYSYLKIDSKPIMILDRLTLRNPDLYILMPIALKSFGLAKPFKGADFVLVYGEHFFIFFRDQEWEGGKISFDFNTIPSNGRAQQSPMREELIQFNNSIVRMKFEVQVDPELLRAFKKKGKFVGFNEDVSTLQAAIFDNMVRAIEDTPANH